MLFSRQIIKKDAIILGVSLISLIIIVGLVIGAYKKVVHADTFASVGSTVPVGLGPKYSVAYDFNNDGSPDLAVSSSGSSEVGIFLNDGHGSFLPVSPIAMSGIPMGIVGADFNADGNGDIAVVDQTNKTVAIFVGAGDGSFAEADTPTISVGVNPSSLAVADFNNDSANDLVAVNIDDGTVDVFLGNGDATFGTPFTKTVGDTPDGIFVADFNSDSDSDIAIVNRGTKTVVILLGAGDGTFAEGVSLSVGVNPSLVTAVDFTGDSIFDLAVTNSADDNVSLFVGVGDGTFSAASQATVSVGSSPRGITSVDLNNDSNMDLVVGNMVDKTVSVLLGNSDGTFTDAVALDVEYSPYTILLAEVNSDAYIDLLTTNFTDDSLSIFLGAPFGAVDHFVVSSLADTPHSTEFSLTVTAKDVFGNTVTDFTGTTELLPSLGTITPSVSDAFVGGVLTQLVSLNTEAVGPGCLITVSTPELPGVTGTSNAFAVYTPATVTNVFSSASDGSYSQGQQIPIYITFDNPVFVTGAPKLLLATGTPATTPALYASGTGTNTLAFTYIVEASHVSSLLDYTSADALELNGGTILDALTHNALLVLPAPGVAGSLSVNNAITIQGLVSGGGGGGGGGGGVPPPIGGAPHPIPNGLIVPPIPIPIPIPVPEPIPAPKPKPEPKSVETSTPITTPTSSSESSGGGSSSGVAPGGAFGGGVPPVVETTTESQGLFSTLAQNLREGCKISATTTVGVLKQETQSSYCQTVLAFHESSRKIEKIASAPTTTVIASTVETVGVVTATSATVTSILFLNPLSFSELFLIPIRLWSLLMAALGLKKRRRPWGTVYDSATKQPLDPAYVVLRSSEGKDIATTFTDLDGRFGFIVPAPGDYTLIAQKSNYLFPSQNLVGHDHDEVYRDLYFGEHFTVAAAGEVVIRNIPMDPEKFDWNEYAKRNQKLMNFYSSATSIFFTITSIFFVLGFVVASVAVVAAPKNYNIAVFILYVILYFFRKYGTKVRPFGHIFEAVSGAPISFAIVRVSYKGTGVELIHRITDARGSYYCLLPNGSYVVRIDRKMPDGSYTTIAENREVVVTQGYLAETFKV